MSIVVDRGGQPPSTALFIEQPVSVVRDPLARVDVLPRVLDRVGAVSLLSNEGQRESLRAGMSYEQFVVWSTLINGIATNMPAPMRGFSEQAMCLAEDSTVGGSEGPVTYIAPDPVLRDELLEATWRGAQRLEGRLPTVGRLLATALFLIQAYPDGNKRTARIVDLIAREGYDGSVTSASAIAKAAANQEARADIAFGDMGDTLASYFSDFMTEGYLKDMGIPAITGVDGAPYSAPAPGLGDEEKEAMVDFLNEPFFNVPLMLAWAKVTGRSMKPFVDQNGVIVVSKVLREFTIDDCQALLWCNDYHKKTFVETIIEAFADGREDVYGDIMRLTDRFWPASAR